jgi:ribonuclease BN (tRNA processing enzyme)
MAPMSPNQTGGFRLTVLGCSSAPPHEAWPAAGFLLEWDTTTVLLDVGQGVVRRLQRLMDPTHLSAVVVGHMHADHYLDLVGLRYLFPWGEAALEPLAVHLPPGGRDRLDALATAVSERPGFFDAAFDAREYRPDEPLRIGPFTIRFVRGRHYVPAWGVVVETPDGRRLGYTGDTGPSDAVVEAMRGVDLLMIEAGLRLPSHDDPERGHLTAEEAIDMAVRSEARSTLLVHYAPGRRAELQGLCDAVGPQIRPAVAGLTITIGTAGGDGTGGSLPAGAYDPRAASSAASARDR